ncbi:scarecrow-like protein 9 [Oryza brachyantha]|uniref:scarecrow-like protein 9 n=1 Tax=Oryza brachyantha TaxID=4533 RepID=UPI000776AA6D|nr:scarecrow-like protein 9 [Oryza brachyantha]
MDSPEYFETNSNITLDYINRILMEEDIDDNISVNKGQGALQATEKLFYDILGKFRRGVEEAKKFVPNIEKLVDDTDRNDLSACKRTIEAREQKGKHENEVHPHVEDLELMEPRNIKHLAISTCGRIRDEMFDSVLLCNRQLPGEVAHLRGMMAKETSDKPKKVQRKGCGQGQRKPRSQKEHKEAINLRVFLMQCAQAIACNDHPFASELIKKIRHHASPYGDGSQRLANCFADGLEAHLAGTGSQMYEKLMTKQTSARDMLKAYHLYIVACPFEMVTYYFSNKTIIDVLEGKPTLHIIDFGILFGFQWPCLIQRLAKGEGGPPKLRITGIDVPQPGFRPHERIEETGKRLAEYANMFNVPFQYHGIASRWETICIEDLSIHKDEVLIINRMSRMRKLGDEMENIDSARDRVLRMMKRMNPEVFILGVVNGLYSSPFFPTRFREVLFHYSSLFDMLDTNVPRNHEARILVEKDIFGNDALNVVACEGPERTERPESYKQWQVRILRAGFKQLPVDQDILKRSVYYKEFYHEDFVIDEDSGWLLQGWKGRIIHALSTWKPS